MDQIFEINLNIFLLVYQCGLFQYKLLLQQLFIEKNFHS